MRSRSARAQIDHRYKKAIVDLEALCDVPHTAPGITHLISILPTHEAEARFVIRGSVMTSHERHRHGILGMSVSSKSRGTWRSESDEYGGKSGDLLELTPLLWKVILRQGWSHASSWQGFVVFFHVSFQNVYRVSTEACRHATSCCTR